MKLSFSDLWSIIANVVLPAIVQGVTNGGTTKLDGPEIEWGYDAATDTLAFGIFPPNSGRFVNCDPALFNPTQEPDEIIMLGQFGQIGSMIATATAMQANGGQLPTQPMVDEKGPFMGFRPLGS